LLVDTGDTTGLARAVRALLSDVAATATLGQAAQARVRTHFTLDREAEGIGAVYQRLFDRG
jgi:mannosyltransferase